MKHEQSKFVRDFCYGTALGHFTGGSKDPRSIGWHKLQDPDCEAIQICRRCKLKDCHQYSRKCELRKYLKERGKSISELE